MMNNSMEDRRRAPRAPWILSIRHHLYKRKGKEGGFPWHVSLTENMSVNGILFHSSAPYLVGDTIELEVFLSGALNVFQGFAKVVRVEKGGTKGGYSIAVMLMDLKRKAQRKKTGKKK